MIDLDDLDKVLNFKYSWWDENAYVNDSSNEVRNRQAKFLKTEILLPV